MSARLVCELAIATPDESDVWPSSDRFGRLVGASPAMRQLYPLFHKVARSSVPVVIEGETGTGKEVLAESIHEESPRRTRPFVVFDCTAVAPSLMEAELFGHERGAFTGAHQTRKGLFELADGGTLFIDEIGDLEPTLQPKLLRVVERGEVRRLGANRTTVVDVRILAATRRDLRHEVDVGRFRDDLYHRLAVARITLPALRLRGADVALLAHHFARACASPVDLPTELLDRWVHRTWPGNVRELKNAVLRYVALGETDPIDGEMHDASEREREPPDVSGGERSRFHIDIDSVLARDLPLAEARELIVEAFEALYVQRLLARNGGNVVRSARAAGIGRRHLQRLRARLPGVISAPRSPH